MGARSVPPRVAAATSENARGGDGRGGRAGCYRYASIHHADVLFHALDPHDSAAPAPPAPGGCAMTRVAVLGGGAAGVTASRRLAQSPGVEVDLIESEPELGGLHHSAIIDGRVYDTGAFVFDSSHELLRSFPELAGGFVPADAAYRRITPAGSVDLYPVSIDGYIRDHGLFGAARAFLDLLISKVRYRNRNSLRAYACYHMGERLYETTGLRQYIARLYGLPDDQIAIEFGLARLRYIENITIRSAISSVIQRAFGRKADAIAPRLMRPRAGFAAFYSGIRSLLEGDGVNVMTSCRLRSVRKVDGDRVELTTDSFTKTYDAVISTIPIAVLITLLGQESKAAYEHMNLVSLFYRGRILREGDLLYNFTLDARWKRMTIFSRLYPQSDADGSDYFTIEVTVPERDTADLDAIRADFEKHCKDFAIADNLSFQGSYTTHRAYPVFRPGQSVGVNRDRELVQSLGIHLAGRQGKFAYISSLEAAAQAKREADVVVAEQAAKR
jgi:protoporphyrinogen oxidase